MRRLERHRVDVDLAEIGRVACDRVVIAEYRVPRGRRKGFLFRAARFFEYAESDDFGSFVRSELSAGLERAGLAIDTPRDVGGYRIWPCRVS